MRNGRFRDNIPLKSSNRIVLENLDNTSTVTLTNAELSDAGVFTIKAKNIGGEVTATANLIVHGEFHSLYSFR